MSAPGFRGDIQALRAVAVALVVAFHLAPSVVRGGYVGVDVFFVISGYLITSHLLREQVRTGRIALRQFYARRIRRLLPAALVVLAACTVACLLLLPASAQRQTLREIAFSALYVENWSLAASAVDYLGAASTPTIVQHYWSLSTEEQFYLVWPVLILLSGVGALRRGWAPRRVIAVVLGAVLAGSLAYSAWITVTDPSWAYFITPARAWEFAAGGMLALIGTESAAARLGTRARGLLSWAGLAAILISAVIFTSDTPFPGVAALVPVLGAVAVMLAGDTPGRWTPTLVGRTAVVQYIGGISYSVYLWHWPLIVLAPVLTGHPVGWRTGLAVIALTLVLAALSKRFVEDPFLRRRVSPFRAGPTFAIAGAGMALVVAVTTVSIVAMDARTAQAAADRAAATSDPCFGAKALQNSDCADPRAVPDDLDTAFAATDYADTTLDDCGKGTTVSQIVDTVECSFGDPDADYVAVIIGDSHAGHWIPALQQIGDQRDWRIVSLVRSSCPFTTVTPSERGVYQQSCEQWKDEVFQRVAGLQPDLVFVASLSPDGYEVAGFDPGTPSEMEAGYEGTLGELAELAPVVALKDTPYMGENMPECLGGVSAGSTACDRARGVVLDGRPDPLWDAAATVPGVNRVDLIDAFCDATICYAVTGGVSIYRDHHHMSASFASSLAPQLEEALLKQGVQLSSR